MGKSINQFTLHYRSLKIIIKDKFQVFTKRAQCKFFFFFTKYRINFSGVFTYLDIRLLNTPSSLLFQQKQIREVVIVFPISSPCRTLNILGLSCPYSNPTGLFEDLGGCVFSYFYPFQVLSLLNTSILLLYLTLLKISIKTIFCGPLPI